MGLRSMKESSQLTMAGLTARVMAISILIVRVYTRTMWGVGGDRKSTRLNSRHGYISYAGFCLKKKNHSNLGLLASQIGRIIAISTTPVIAGVFYELAVVGAIRLCALRCGISLDSTEDMLPLYI